MIKALRWGVLASVAAVALLAGATPAMAMIGPFGYGGGYDGRCLTEHNPGSPNAYTTAERCDGRNAQKWFHFGDGNYHGVNVLTIKSGASSDCVSPNPNSGDHDGLAMYPCREDDPLINQQRLLWIPRYHDVGGGRYYYSFESYSQPNYCLDVINDGRGETVGIYWCHRNANQLWRQA